MGIFCVCWVLYSLVDEDGLGDVFGHCGGVGVVGVVGGVGGAGGRGWVGVGGVGGFWGGKGGGQQQADRRKSKSDRRRLLPGRHVGQVYVPDRRPEEEDE